MVLDLEVDILKRNLPFFEYTQIENGNHFLHSSTKTVDKVNEKIKAFLKKCN